MMLVSDLDDTLYKEIDFVKSGYRAIGRELDCLGLMNMADAVETLEGAGSMRSGIDLLAAKLLLKNPEIRNWERRLVEIYRFHTPDIRLPEEVAATLEELKGRGVEFGIITDGRSLTQRAKIAALGLDRFVSERNIIISEETGADKTSSTPFELIQERNPGENRRVYVGDNPAKDFYWPNRLGWLTVMLADNSGTNIHAQTLDVVPEQRARNLIQSFAEILPIMID